MPSASDAGTPLFVLPRAGVWFLPVTRPADPHKRCGSIPRFAAGRKWTGSCRHGGMGVSSFWVPRTAGLSAAPVEIAGRLTAQNQTPARGNTKGGVPASYADGTTRTTKRGKIVGRRLHIRVYVGYNQGSLKRFMPSICPPGQGSGGCIGGRIRSSATGERAMSIPAAFTCPSRASLLPAVLSLSSLN